MTSGTASGSYLVELVAFAVADDNTARANCQGTRSGTVLATASGTVTTTMATAASMVFTPTAGNAHLGKDCGIRLIKATSSVLYDNIRLVVGHDTNPTPASGA